MDNNLSADTTTTTTSVSPKYITIGIIFGILIGISVYVIYYLTQTNKCKPSGKLNFFTRKCECIGGASETSDGQCKCPAQTSFINGKCTSCGTSSGQICCDTDPPCDTSRELVCVNGVCQECGFNDKVCCPGGKCPHGGDNRMECVAGGTCQLCGNMGSGCCVQSNPACTPPFICNSNKCVECGLETMACCHGDPPCDTSRPIGCIDGVCQECGMNGKICCPDGKCPYGGDDRMECVAGGTCQLCGNMGGGCCVKSDPPCTPPFVCGVNNICKGA